MGRARTKSKKIKPVSTQNTAESSNQPSVPSLLAKAQALIVQCDYPLAERFIKRALEKEPTNAEAREMLAVVLLETGEIDTAKQIFETLIPPHPDAPSPPPSSAYLYLAQLSDDDPQAALQHYQNAVDLMNSQLKGKERAVDSSGNDDDAEVRRNIVRALVGMVEIWMDPSYDLCFDPAAESTCESLLTLALQTDPNNTEALQALASVRLSQQRPDEAQAYLLQSWASWKDLLSSPSSPPTSPLPPTSTANLNIQNDYTKIPPIQTRISLSKMFLELECFEEALVVLTGIIDEDDQEVEAWYLEGWCLFLMAEKMFSDGGAGDGTKLEGSGEEGEEGEVSAEGFARDARDCLETCRALHETQDHPDKPLLEHVQELIGRLEAMGIQPSPDDEDLDGGEGVGDGEWEDVGSDDDGDGDVEMS